MHRHRRIKLGRYAEAKVCLKCKRVWVNEEFHTKSNLIAMCGNVVGKDYSVFNEEEMAILKSLETSDA